MSDNVISSVGGLTVATKEDPTGVQHQAVVPEFMVGALPLPARTISPFPTEDVPQQQLLTSILIELRVLNDMLYKLMASEVEPLDMMRAVIKDMPVVL